MATAVTPNDVADRLGRVRPAFDSPAWLQAQKFIDQADLLITRYQARNALPDPDGADRDYVILEAVAAIVRNPDDATSVDVQIDDGRVSKRYSSSSGKVSLEDWWDTLWPDSDNRDSGAFTIRPHFVPDIRGPW